MAHRISCSRASHRLPKRPQGQGKRCTRTNRPTREPETPRTVVLIHKSLPLPHQIPITPPLGEEKGVQSTTRGGGVGVADTLISNSMHSGTTSKRCQHSDVSACFDEFDLTHQHRPRPLSSACKAGLLAPPREQLFGLGCGSGNGLWVVSALVGVSGSVSTV